MPENVGAELLSRTVAGMAVDAADYSVWQHTLGSTNNLAADGDSIVDAGDYDVWKTNFGAGATGSASAAIPEPWYAVAFGSGRFDGFISRRRRESAVEQFRSNDPRDGIKRRHSS